MQHYGYIRRSFLATKSALQKWIREAGCPSFSCDVVYPPDGRPNPSGTTLHETGYLTRNDWLIPSSAGRRETGQPAPVQLEKRLANERRAWHESPV